MALDPTKLIAPEYASQIGVRASASDPNTAEYYNAKTGTAFENPQNLANFVQSTYKKNDVNQNNIFDVLKTSTAQPLLNNQSPQPSRIDELKKALFTNPVNSQNIYEEEYKNSGVGDIKSRLSDIDKEIAKIRDKYTQTSGNISENPWLSEASRVGRLRILNDQMQSEIGNYLEQKNQLSDLYNLGLNEVQLRLGLRTNDLANQRSIQEQELEFLLNQNQTEQSRQNAGIEFAYNNNIQSPFFEIGGTIYRTSDLKAYPTPEAFFADGGAQDFSNVQKVSNQPEDKLLSPTEAARLGVPYGTTQQEAAAMAITPSYGRTSSGSKSGSSKSASSNGSSVGLKSTADTSGEIRAWIIANKRANPDAPYYELWGQLADTLRNQGLNPENYDQVFWEVLHPEGLAGYQREQDKKKQESKRSI